MQNPLDRAKEDAKYGQSDTGIQFAHRDARPRGFAAQTPSRALIQFHMG